MTPSSWSKNIARFLRAGHSRTQAAILATRQIFQAILGCTGTIMLAFLPLTMIGGNSGLFIRVMPIAVFANGRRLAAGRAHDHPLPREPAAARARRPAWQLRVAVADHDDPPLLPAARAQSTRAAAHGALGIAGSLPGRHRRRRQAGRFSLFPKADTPNFLITVETPDGSSLAETDRALRFVEEKLRATPEVVSFFTNLGHGNPIVYYNVSSHDGDISYGDLFVKLRSYDPDATPRVLERLRDQFKEYANARIYVREFSNGPAISAPIAMRLIGPDLDELHRLAAAVEKTMRATPGTRDVQNPVRMRRTNLSLDIDSQKAALLGVPAGEFDRAVRLAVAGIPAGALQDSDGEQYDIMVRTPSRRGRTCVRSIRSESQRSRARRCRSRSWRAWSSPPRRRKSAATTASVR
jgi:multidrug efflux pump subunit AcrB